MREKDDETPPEESAAEAAWTSLRWRSNVEDADASRSPESCFPFHSPLEHRQTNVKTPIIVLDSHSRLNLRKEEKKP